MFMTSSNLFFVSDRYIKINLSIKKQNLKAYDRVLEPISDIVHDDSDIRRALKTKIYNSSSALSVDAERSLVEKDKEWLLKTLMWMSSGPMRWTEEKNNSSSDVLWNTRLNTDISGKNSGKKNDKEGGGSTTE